jgi:hypothetical protein
MVFYNNIVIKICAAPPGLGGISGKLKEYLNRYIKRKGTK